MSDPAEKAYAIEGMNCEHCERAVATEVGALAGVESARADRVAGRLVVRGAGIDDAAIREAVEEAGYALAAPGALPRTEDERHGVAEAGR